MVTIPVHPASLAQARQSALLSAQERGESISEREVLQVMSVLALYDGTRILPNFMRLAGAVLAKALDSGKLPNRKLGTGWSGRHDPLAVARAYFDRLDGGEKHKDIIEDLEKELHLGARRIEQLIEEGQALVGDTKALRDEFRARDAMLADLDTETRRDTTAIEPDHSTTSQLRTDLIDGIEKRLQCEELSAEESYALREAFSAHLEKLNAPNLAPRVRRVNPPLELDHGMTSRQLADIIGPSRGSRKSPAQRKTAPHAKAKRK